MTTAQESIAQRLEQIVVEAWAAGYAIKYWAPSEVGDADATELIDIVAERGNDYLDNARQI